MNGGELILRNEDLDATRFKMEFVDAVLEDLLSGWMTALTERIKWPAGEKAIDLAAGGWHETT